MFRTPGILLPSEYSSEEEFVSAVRKKSIDAGYATLQHSAVDDILEHHGIKGMKWGVRRSQVELGGGRVAKIKPGGVAHPDAKMHNSNHARTKAHGTGVLSDTEMQKLVNRMNLEQNFSRLNSASGGEAKIKRGHNYVKAGLAAGVTVNSMILFAKSPAGQAIAQALKDR